MSIVAIDSMGLFGGNGRRVDRSVHTYKTTISKRKDDLFCMGNGRKLNGTVIAEQALTHISDWEYRAGEHFAVNFIFSGHLAALPRHLTALAVVAPRLDPSVALAPPGFGGRQEFGPDWHRLFKTMFWTHRL
ncbi:hypothetical protein HOY82DRAFT_601516 [Tuber indicum]|nr:hypothetical protein HOY82DRAFT_601516 [Tuber indicum]